MRALIAEDNATHREHAKEVLEGLAFHVVEAWTAEGALAAFRTRGPWDLIVTDDQMPRRAGRFAEPHAIDLLTKFREAEPDLPVVVFCNGWAQKLGPAVEAEGGVFVAKTDGLDALAAAVRRLVPGPGEAA